MNDLVIFSLIALLVNALWTVFIRAFPGVLTTIVAKRLEFRYSHRLSRLKAEQDARYSTLSASLAFLAGGQTEFRSKTITAVETLWNGWLEIDKEVSDLSLAEDILVTAEIAKFFEEGDPRIEPYLRSYRESDLITKQLQRSAAWMPAKNRLFCGERLWLLAGTFFAAHGRRCFLYHQSFEKGKYINWRTDDQMDRILRSIVPQEVVEGLKEQRVGAFRQIVAHLEAEFLKEAVRVMSGSQHLAESLADLQATLLIEQQKLTKRDEGTTEATD
ncbi:MAG: hypothetical protein OXH75_26625 [Acidobacteria bacterium]|nr:hypothetical protein [Acidobacteriota bacterium]